MLNGSVIQAPNGSKFFDADSIISPNVAKLFRAHGYAGAIRYVGRRTTAPQDIRPAEAQGILAANLALMLVQHVQQPGWIPSYTLGLEYGTYAASSAVNIGYVSGGTIWCDLEGVKLHEPDQETIDFCNAWVTQVGHAGYTPGFYIGYEPGATGIEFYSKTNVEHFWRAYNGDIIPPTRGFQMAQKTEQIMAGIHFDPNTVMTDKLGGLPLILAPAGWTVPV